MGQAHTRYAEGEAPWSEDEQFEERAKACKARCKKYGFTCGQGGEEDYEYEGECDECDHDAIDLLKRKYRDATTALSAARATGGTET